MKILFVDDETRILTGIENALIFGDDDWEADYASSGEQALSMMNVNTYDVLVTDMKMPGLTGADVLEHAMANHPQVIRLILSGEVDPDLAERAMPLTHEFVSKPCDPEDLFTIIDRVYTASRTLEDSTVRDVLGSLDRLPAQPNLHLKIQDTLERGEGVDAIANLVEADLAIATTIIKTSNSAFYGFRTPAETVRDAVVRLGTQTVTGIVLNAEVASWATPEMKDLVTQLNAHSAMIADLVRKLVGKEVKQAALAGLLHDIGVLVLITQFPDQYETLRAVTPPGESANPETERQIFGATHSEIGACMLEMWNADPVVVEATRYHHQPDDTAMSDDARRIISAITAADLAHHPELEPPEGLDPDLIALARTLTSDA